MILTQSRGTKIGYLDPPLRQTVAGGFGQVVVILFFDADEAVVVFVWDAVTITDDNLSRGNMTDGTVATDDVTGTLQESPRELRGRETVR